MKVLVRGVHEGDYSLQDLGGSLWNGWHDSKADALISPLFLYSAPHRTIYDILSSPNVTLETVFIGDRTYTRKELFGDRVYTLSELKQEFPEYFI